MIDTSRLASFRKRYDLALICGITDPTKDRFTDTRITVSPPFTIQPGGISIIAPHSKEMAAALRAMTNAVITKLPKGVPTTVTASVWNEIVLVPKGSDLSTIHRLEDVGKYGGKILKQGYFE